MLDTVLSQGDLIATGIVYFCVLLMSCFSAAAILNKLQQPTRLLESILELQQELDTLRQEFNLFKYRKVDDTNDNHRQQDSKPIPIPPPPIPAIAIQTGQFQSGANAFHSNSTQSKILPSMSRVLQELSQKERKAVAPFESPRTAYISTKLKSKPVSFHLNSELIGSR